MKNLFLAASLMFFSMITAQTEKGNFIISGKSNLNFTSENLKNSPSEGALINSVTTNTFNFSPNFGYFVIDNLAIGVLLDFKIATSKVKLDQSYDPIMTYEGSSKQTITTISFIPNATYYFSEGKIRPYLSAGAGFSNIHYNNNANVNAFTWTGNGGILVFVAQKIALDLGIGYTNYSAKSNGRTITSNAFGANVGINIFLK